MGEIRRGRLRPRPVRKIIYLRQWKIEWRRSRAAYVGRHCIASDRNRSPSRCATPRNRRRCVCARARADDFFYPLIILFAAYLRRALEMTDGGLKIASTKVTGSIYVLVEFTLQIVSRFIQLRACGRLACFFAEIHVARQKCFFFFFFYARTYAHAALFARATSARLFARANVRFMLNPVDIGVPFLLNYEGTFLSIHY